MNSYKILKKHQHAEVNALPIKFAFSNKQFEEAMAEWGLTPKDTDKLYKLGGTGGFYLRTDAEKIQNTFVKNGNEMKAAIQQYKTGNGFIFDMLVSVTWDFSANVSITSNQVFHSAANQNSNITLTP